MPADVEFRDTVVQKLATIPGLSCRSMFGGFGVFSDDNMFGLISGSELFLKVDESNRSAYEEAGSKKHGPMPYYKVPDAVLKDDSELLKWAITSLSIARATTKKKKR